MKKIKKRVKRSKLKASVVHVPAVVTAFEAWELPPIFPIKAVRPRKKPSLWKRLKKALWP